MVRVWRHTSRRDPRSDADTSAPQSTGPQTIPANTVLSSGQGVTSTGGTTGQETASASVTFSATPNVSVVNGNDDAFVARLDLLPTGVSAFGRSSPGCAGLLAVSVSSMPHVGNANFSFICGNAPPRTVGLLAFTDAGLPSPVTLLGVEIWLDPSTLFVTASAASGSTGVSEVSAPVPNNAGLAGVRLCTQFLWRGPTSPAPCPPQGFSTSNGLAFTIQP